MSITRLSMRLQICYNHRYHCLLPSSYAGVHIAMPQEVVIENPILNFPFEEPTRHFKFGDYGITSEIVQERRVSSYFVPIARPRMAGQMVFDTEWTQDRINENVLIN